jgi:hypothetical protein
VMYVDDAVMGGLVGSLSGWNSSNAGSRLSMIHIYSVSISIIMYFSYSAKRP